MGLRQIALVVLVLALTIVGFVGARVLGERDVQRDSAHRAEIAATALQSDLRHAAGLLEGLRRFMVANVAVTTKQFADLGPNVLSADDLGAAAWVQRVPASSRAEYERRVGHRIVAATPSGALAPAGRRPWYLPATLVTGYPPVTVPGVDLAGEPGVAAAVARQQTLFRATSTPLARMPEGPVGLFLVESAQRFTRGGLEPGFLVLFVPDSWLLAAAAQPGGPNARLQLMIGGTSAGDLGGGATARSAFTALGQRFQVLVPRGSVDGAAALSPWVILGVGLVLAALTAALGVNAARRARAQRDLDRVFTVSPDLIAVAGFDGYFKRVNPAFEHILGYAAEELLARPFIEFVHPDDREATSAAAEALQRGETLVSFENRYVCKDGSYRWIEWASTPGLEERLIYAVARDITDRRRAEAEEAALRRMATIVARGVRPAEVFDAVAAEMRQLLGADVGRLMRYEQDGTGTIFAGSDDGIAITVGTRLTLEGESVAASVFRTGRPARIQDYARASGPTAALLRKQGIRSSVGTPIVVDGRLWGVMVAAWREEQAQQVLADTELRMAQFTELVATGIANADSRAQLSASRARVLAAADEARRRIERDLHDGAQQRLVSLALAVRSVEAMVAPGQKIRQELSNIADGLTHVLDELQDISRGIHPAMLSQGGLGPALRTLARRSAAPVELRVGCDRRFREGVEVAVYYVASEALANAAKHADASVVHVDLVAEDGTVQLTIRDDGVGGADPAQGSGLIGLRDRVEALGGTIEVASPAGEGTVLSVTIPVDDARE